MTEAAAQSALVFDPAQDERAFRHALGGFATGVTVVTAMQGGVPIGITANSFASVSLDPPLVLWSPAKASARFVPFTEAEHYAIHVLGAEQKALCDTFARTGARFDGVQHDIGESGAPILPGALAVFECRREAVHDAGDHAVVIGRVLRVRHAPGAPLVFQGGAFGGFCPA